MQMNKVKREGSKMRESSLVDTEIAHRATQKEQDQNKTAEEAKEEAEGELLELKRKGLLSYKNLIDVDGKYVGHFQSSKAKGLLPEFEEKVAEAIEKHNVTNKQKWLANRVQHALPKKTRMNSRGKRKIGEVCDEAARGRGGSAIETAANLEGLYQEFELGVLSDLMNAFDAITSGKEGGLSSNKCCVFSDAQKEAIALAKCMERNNLVATIQDDGQGRNAVTNGVEVKAFIRKYGKRGLALLEKQSRKHARDKASGRGIDDNTIHAAGSLTWATGAKVVADYLNIMRALDHPKVCAVIDKKGSWRVLVCGEKKMKKQNCVGTNDREYDEFERELEDCEYTFVELWTTSEKPLVIDSDAKVDPSRNDDPLNKKIKLAGTDRYVRAVCITDCTAQPLTTFQCYVSGKNEKHHRLVAIYERHYGWGFNQTPLIKEYLGLKDGESFEDHERFKYHHGAVQPVSVPS
eukprot:scaffold12782_cov88-Skeletonema_dohrnii-CCMP3373.AAC.1